MARAKKYDEQEEKSKKHKEAAEVSKWLTRINHSEAYRKHISDKYRWPRLIEEYRGYFQGLQDAADIYIPSLNLIYAYVKSEIPALAIRDPKIKVNPKKGSSVLAAKILEKALTYLWRTKRIKRENKKNILDSLLVSHSWFKTGYTGKFGLMEDGNGNAFEFIESEDFFGYRIPYENVTFNPDCQDPPYDCTWIAHKVTVPLDEIKGNKLYKHVDDLSPSANENELSISPNVSATDDINRRGDPDVKRVTLYEIWDKPSQMILTVSPGCEYFVQEPRKWPYAMKGFPFSFLRLNEDPMSPYGIPDCFMFEPQVLELMKIRATQLDHLKRFNRQLLLREGAMSPDSKEQFAQGVTGAVIEVQVQPGESLSNVAAPIPYPQIQTDIYAIEERIKEDLLNVSGQSATQRGAAQKTTTRSLGELERIEDGGANRRSDKVDTVEDFIEDIAGNLVALLQQLADVPYYVRITGDDPEKIIEGLGERPSASQTGAVTADDGFTFTKEDIKGAFDFEVVSGSMTPLNQDQKNQIVQFILQNREVLGLLPGGPVSQFLGNEIADDLDMPGLKKAIIEEQKMAQEQAAAAAEQQKKMQEMQVAQITAETQIKAEREATKQNQVMLQGMKTIHDMNNPPEKKNV